MRTVKQPLLLLSVFFVLCLFHSSASAKNVVEDKLFDFIGAELKIKSFVKNPSVKIGEKFSFLINVTAESGIDVEMPELSEKLKVLNINVEDSERSRRSFFNKKFYQFKYKLVCYKPGEYKLSGIKVLYKKEGEQAWQEAVLRDRTIFIKSVLSPDAQIQEVKDIKGLIVPRQSFSVFLITLALFFAIGGILIYCLVKKDIICASEKKESAHDIALHKIKELKKQDFIGRGLVKEFYFQLSLIARRYLEDRFELRAPEMTTEEFLYSLKDAHALSAEHKILLKEFLFNCDLVKFAKYAPVEKEIDQALAAIINLIEQTKQENVQELK